MNNSSVNFIIDGIRYSPKEYLEKLIEIDSLKPIERDFYGTGGVTESLEKKFAELTGKEKAVYLPTGTMANELALKLLSGVKSKVIVPENSHIFRDEGDAAQSVHSKKLIPLGKDKPFYDLEDLKYAVEFSNKNEAYNSGLGAVVIENPVRRADGAIVPLKIIRQISDYCRINNFKLHLDGSRLHIASAYSNVSVSEYASYFDTVYISLYKYLNAAGGAVLCGDAKIIDQIPHQIKIHGGTILQSWLNTAVALHYLDGIDLRWKEIIKTSKKLIRQLNKIKGINVTSPKNFSNNYILKLSKSIDSAGFAKLLFREHRILIGRVNEKGVIKLVFNESLLMRDIGEIVNAFREGIKKS